MSDLLPCPFCGKTEGLSIFKEFFDYVNCANCSYSIPLEVWNNRPYENKIKAEAVREAVEALKSESELGLVIYRCQALEYVGKLEGGEL